MPASPAASTTWCSTSTANPCEGGELLATGQWSDCQAPWGAAKLNEVNLEAGTYHLIASSTWTTTGGFEILVQATPPRPTTGGPDEMGYVWTNSLDEEGPDFDWVDISATGVNVPLTDDSYAGPFEMGIDFPFYEGTYNQCWIGSNGYVSFTQGYSSLSAQPFPTPTDGWSPDNFIALFWDDLWPVVEGNVTYLSDPANGRFIVQFTNVPGCCSDTNPRHTFQVILYDTGDYLMQYLDMGEGDLSFFGVGQENTDGTIGLQYRYQFDGGLVADGVAFYVDALEGDFRPPMISLVDVPSDIETELPGDHAVTATVTDETGLASVTLVYTVNGGDQVELAMSMGANNLWSGAIPHQPANTLVEWWVVAVDATDLHNTRTTAAQSFDVVSYQTAPQNLNATDGLQTGTTITWMPPPNIEVWGLFGGDLPESEDEAISRLMAEHGMDKLQAAAVWQRWRQPAEREFEGFRLYRDDEMIAELDGLSFTDHLDSGSEADVVYTYAVTAVFTAGESDRSNEDQGSWATAPSSGGPDAFGYIWRSSLDPRGPDYEWTDIVAIGTNLGLMGDDAAVAVTLPFEFPWYGNFYTNAWVSTNGYVTFQSTATPYWNGPLPDPNLPNDVVYAMWDDLYVGWNGGAVYQYDDTENERVIFQWDGVHPLGNSNTPLTFQIILSTSGIAHVVYEDIAETEVLDVTVGTENADGTDGLQVTWDAQGMPILDESVLAILPPSNCEPVECAGTQETEPNEGWNDNNASYDVIHCGETMCGTVLADGASTDTDWYLYTHFGGNITVELEVSDFNGRVSLREQALNGATLAQAGTFPRCFDEAFSANNLPAGTYYIVVEHTGTPDVTTPQTYSVSLTCSGDPCSGHEPVVCEGTAEVEPNEGWNSNNASYGLISLGQTVCGSTWANAGSRDMDWFRFTLTQPASVILECEQDAFDAALFITDFATSGSVLAEVDESPACWPEALQVADLAPGDYYAVVSHNSFDGVPAPQNYSLTLRLAGVVEDPCDNYVDHGNFHDIAHVNRPAPQNFHHNGTGCPGNVSSPGRDEVVRLVLAQATDLQVTLQGAGNADEVILLLGNCAQPESSCGAAVNAQGAGPGVENLVFPNLPAGDYFVVADFAGPGETASYQMTIIDMESDMDEGRALDFVLEPAYPNPFNPSTTLGWTQPSLAAATLTVRDVRGAVVETLDLGVRGAGRHAYTWDATRFGSGVYFCTLTAGGHAATVKAVLLK